MAEERAPQVPISDFEREATAALLRDASLDGRLTLEEYTRRAGWVVAARTRDQLDLVTADLPPAPPVSLVPRAPVHWSVAVLGEVKRSGFWRIGDRCWAVSVMGDPWAPEAGGRPLS
jgi:hypothetical protein